MVELVGDPTAAKDPFALIEDSGLPRRNGVLGFGKANRGRITVNGREDGLRFSVTIADTGLD